MKTFVEGRRKTVVFFLVLIMCINRHSIGTGLYLGAGKCLKLLVIPPFPLILPWFLKALYRTCNRLSFKLR